MEHFTATSNTSTSVARSNALTCGEKGYSDMIINNVMYGCAALHGGCHAA